MRRQLGSAPLPSHLGRAEKSATLLRSRIGAISDTDLRCFWFPKEQSPRVISTPLQPSIIRRYSKAISAPPYSFFFLYFLFLFLFFSPIQSCLNHFSFNLSLSLSPPPIVNDLPDFCPFHVCYASAVDSVILLYSGVVS